MRLPSVGCDNGIEDGAKFGIAPNFNIEAADQPLDRFVRDYANAAR
jgi:hypothetical protein